MYKSAVIIIVTSLLYFCCDNGQEPNKGPGVILQTFVADSLKIADTASVVFLTAEVEDPDGLDDVESVYFYSRKPDGTLSNEGNSFPMKDDGVNGDSAANDGIYTGKIIISSSAQAGFYIFSFQMEDRAGNLSNEVSDTMKVYKELTEPNKGPGTILETYVADSIQIPVSQAASVVSAKVEDPDGLDDVESVYFFSRKPDGTLANGGNSIVMFDNGTEGDSTAGDGIYSTGITITFDSQAGTYVFTFYMSDKAGNLSDAKMDSIEVYE